MGCLRPYEPINRLRPVADDLWIVDGPEIRMRYFGLRLPFTTRMTIIRLSDGRLWVHSPTEPTTASGDQRAGTGGLLGVAQPAAHHLALGLAAPPA